MNSRAMVAASAWRFFRHGAGMLGGAASILCLPGLLYGLIWMLDPETAHHLRDNQGVFESVFRCGLWIVLPLYLLTEMMHIQPLFALPLTNRQIVDWQLFWGVLAIVGVHLIAVLFYRSAFGAIVPVWEPLLFMIPAVAAAAGMAAVLADFRWWRPFVIAALVFGTAAAIVNRPSWLSGRAALPTESLGLTPTWPELGGVLILAATGYVLALWGVAKARCGELRNWPDFDVLLHRCAARLGRLLQSPVGSRAYRSGVSAQFWYEFWEKGLVLPLIVGFIGGVSLIHGYLVPHEWLGGLFDASPVIVGLCLAGAGLIIAFINLGGKVLVIREYRAVRPLSDAQLASSVLRAALASAALALLVLGAEALLVGGWSTIRAARGLSVQPRAVDLPTALPIAALIGWSALGLIASVVMSGRAWVMVLPWGLLFGLFVGDPLLKVLFPPAVLPFLLHVLAGALLAAIIVTTVAAHAFALGRRLITVKTTMLAAITWLATTALIGMTSVGPRDLKGLVLLAGWMTFVAAPLATAPLALAWNRHR
ncbi:MAG: hypothetical protein AB7U20_00985 [Planctomycetaceae bacterium]